MLAATCASSLLALSGCGPKPHDGALPPPPVPLLAPIPEAPLSVLKIPVEVDLDFARDRILKSLPKPLSQQTVQKKVQLGGIPFAPEVGVEFRHKAELENLDLRLDGSLFQATVRASFAVGTSVVGGASGIGLASCGEKPGEPTAALDFTLKGRLAWGQDGAILFAPSPWEMKWVRPCQLTAFKVKLEDVLDLPLIRNQVQTAITQAVQKIPEAVKIRPIAEQAWKELGKPRAVLPGVFLVTRPESLSLGALTGNGKIVKTSITLRARPTLTDSLKPTDTGRALPTMRFEPTGDGIFHLDAQASVPLTTLDSMMSATLSAQTFKAGSRDVKIVKATLFGGGDKAVLGVTLAEPIKGDIFLRGRPEFDTVTNSIHLADLDFETNTESFLVGAANYLLHGTIQSAIQKAAVVDISKFMPRLSDIHLPAGDVGEVQVSIQSLRPLGISLDDGHLRTWLRLEGKTLVRVGAVAPAGASAVPAVAPKP